LIWHFTLVLIKINYGQIGDQTGLLDTTNPVFYTSAKDLSVASPRLSVGWRIAILRFFFTIIILPHIFVCSISRRCLDQTLWNLVGISYAMWSCAFKGWFFQNGCHCHGNGQNAKKLKNTKMIIAGYSPNRNWWNLIGTTSTSSGTRLAKTIGINWTNFATVAMETKKGGNKKKWRSNRALRYNKPSILYECKRFVRRTGTFGNLWFFSLVPSDNHNTRSTCLTSVFTGIGQTLMSRPDLGFHGNGSKLES
jgi:hypothetical protein